MDILIKKIESKDEECFDILCNWQYNWWGIIDNYSYEHVVRYMENSMCSDKIPQTYVAFIDNIPVGMYQIQIHDLDTRPDIYPWLANLYVDEKYRGCGVCKEMIEHAKTVLKSLNIKEIFIYTKHTGLYEKYGWKFLYEVDTFKDYSPKQRLYKYEI